MTDIADPNASAVYRRDINLDQRIDAVKSLIGIFRMERVVYLVITSASLLMLLTAVIAIMSKDQQNLGVLTALFGSSGLITYSLGRLLRMWDQALEVLMRDLKMGQP